jgi:hypothetical protein
MRNDFKWEVLEDVFQEYYPDRSFTRPFIISIWKNFSGNFSDNAMANFMMLACENTGTSEGALKYFCGICWRKIKSGDLENWNVQSLAKPIVERRSGIDERRNPFNENKRESGQEERTLH